MAKTKVFKWKNKTQRMTEWLRLRRINDVFADFTLWCEGRQVRCHRFMLAAASPYLNAMFVMDSTLTSTCLLDMTHEELMDVLALIYEGSVPLNSDRLQAFEHAIRRPFKINVEDIETSLDMGFSCKTEDIASDNNDGQNVGALAAENIDHEIDRCAEEHLLSVKKEVFDNDDQNVCEPAEENKVHVIDQCLQPIGMKIAVKEEIFDNEADTRVVVKEEECATQHQPNNPVTDSRWSPVPVTTSVDDSYTGITWRQPDFPWLYPQLTSTTTTIWPKPYYIQVDEIMHQMQADTIDEAITKVFGLGNLSSQGRSHLLAFLVTEHAIRNVNKTPIYVEFVMKIIKIECACRPIQDSGLRKHFIDNCERIYHNEVEFLVDYKSGQQRGRSLGIMRLLGVMYLYGMLSSGVFNSLTSTLFDFNKNCRLECYYELVAVTTCIGGRFMRPSVSVSRQLDRLQQKLMEPGLNLIRDTRIRLQKLSAPNCHRWLILGEFDPDAKAVLDAFALQPNTKFAQNSASFQPQANKLPSRNKGRRRWKKITGRQTQTPY